MCNIILYTFERIAAYSFNVYLALYPRFVNFSSNDKLHYSQKSFNNKHLEI